MRVFLKVKIPIPLILTCPALLDSSGPIILVLSVRNQGRGVVANVILVISKYKVENSGSVVVEKVLDLFERLCHHDVKLNVHSVSFHFIACPSK